jgi:hypothetical protein
MSPKARTKAAGERLPYLLAKLKTPRILERLEQTAATVLTERVADLTIEGPVLPAIGVSRCNGSTRALPLVQRRYTLCSGATPCAAAHKFLPLG